MTTAIPVEAVLFDLFGVIARVQDDAGKAAIEAAGLDGAHAAERRTAFWERYWAHRPPYDRGDVDGDAYWRGVGKALGTPYDDARVAALIEADLASWSAYDDTMLELLGAWAAAGRRLALLSNIPLELADRVDGRPWLRHFEVVGFSCRIGAVKPDAAAFDRVLRALDLPPERVLFTDDTQVNIDAADALGLRTHRFTGRADLETHAARLDRT